MSEALKNGEKEEDLRPNFRPKPGDAGREEKTGDLRSDSDALEANLPDSDASEEPERKATVRWTAREVADEAMDFPPRWRDLEAVKAALRERRVAHVSCPSAKVFEGLLHALRKDTGRSLVALDPKHEGENWDDLFRGLREVSSGEHYDPRGGIAVIDARLSSGTRWARRPSAEDANRDVLRERDVQVLVRRATEGAEEASRRSVIVVDYIEPLLRDHCGFDTSMDGEEDALTRLADSLRAIVEQRLETEDFTEAQVASELGSLDKQKLPQSDEEWRNWLGDVIDGFTGEFQKAYPAFDKPEEIGPLPPPLFFVGLLGVYAAGRDIERADFDEMAHRLLEHRVHEEPLPEARTRHGEEEDPPETSDDGDGEASGSGKDEKDGKDKLPERLPVRHDAARFYASGSDTIRFGLNLRVDPAKDVVTFRQTAHRDTIERKLDIRAPGLRDAFFVDLAYSQLSETTGKPGAEEAVAEWARAAIAERIARTTGAERAAAWLARVAIAPKWRFCAPPFDRTVDDGEARKAADDAWYRYERLGKEARSARAVMQLITKPDALSSLGYNIDLGAVRDDGGRAFSAVLGIVATMMEESDGDEARSDPRAVVREFFDTLLAEDQLGYALDLAVQLCHERYAMVGLDLIPELFRRVDKRLKRDLNAGKGIDRETHSLRDRLVEGVRRLGNRERASRALCGVCGDWLEEPFTEKMKASDDLLARALVLAFTNVAERLGPRPSNGETQTRFTPVSLDADSARAAVRALLHERIGLHIDAMPADDEYTPQSRIEYLQSLVFGYLRALIRPLHYDAVLARRLPYETWLDIHDELARQLKTELEAGSEMRADAIIRFHRSLESLLEAAVEELREKGAIEDGGHVHRQLAQDGALPEVPRLYEELMQWHQVARVLPVGLILELVLYLGEEAREEAIEEIRAGFDRSLAARWRAACLISRTLIRKTYPDLKKLDAVGREDVDGLRAALRDKAERVRRLQDIRRAS